MVMCKRCFATNTEDRKFCINCGGLVKEDDQCLIEDFVIESGLEKWRDNK